MGDTLETTFQYNPVWLNADPRGAVPYAEDDGSYRTNSGISTTTKFGVKFGLNSTQQQVLTLMLENPAVTAAQAAQAVEVTKRQIEYTIAKLKKLGLVSREGADKKGRWIVNQEALNG